MGGLLATLVSRLYLFPLAGFCLLAIPAIAKRSSRMLGRSLTDSLTFWFLGSLLNSLNPIDLRAYFAATVYFIPTTAFVNPASALFPLPYPFYYLQLYVVFAAPIFFRLCGTAQEPGMRVGILRRTLITLLALSLACITFSMSLRSVTTIQGQLAGAPDDPALPEFVRDMLMLGASWSLGAFTAIGLSRSSWASRPRQACPSFPDSNFAT
jgi:hypothetical protein